MRLLSFQIKNCFGFRDSDPIKLDELPSNLIYVLGKNSSGKTSLLTALASFSPERIPQQQSNFENFNSYGETPSLIAHYAVSPTDFSVEAFIQAFRRKMREINVADGTVAGSAELQRLSLATEEIIVPLYTELINNIKNAKEVWVRRNGAGEFQFSPEEMFKDVDPRLQQVSDAQPVALATANKPQTSGQQNMLFIQNGWRPVQQLQGRHIESLLSEQLMKIIWFGKADSQYPLAAALPPEIAMSHLDSQEPLLNAFISLLDREEVRKILIAKSAKDRTKILSGMQQQIDLVIAKVNQAARDVGSEDLLKITVSRRDGLQIIAETVGEKESSYSHISDNTKFLFAFYLYLHVHKFKEAILLFDEPNNGFHATAQEELLNFLKVLGTQGNLVVVSTHSEHLIDLELLGGVRLMDIDDEQCLKVRNKWNTKTEGKGSFLGLRPIQDAIGLKYGANHLSIHDKVVVTEGITEFLYLQALRRLLGYEEELHIAPAVGDDTMLHVIALLLSQELHFKVVADTTTSKKSIKTKIQEAYLLPDDTICEIDIPNLPGIPQAKGSGIEDIFSKDDFGRLLNSTGN
ncbi:MAG TPA: AAA family ATPase, partial [Ktedonobacteraceae bacterium]|nr:AAA family ATPase [Ktedonobacteraceae bacterium]